MSETQSRHLKAIMFTDISGYTSLMGKGEDHALTILDHNRKIHQQLISKYGGNLLKEMGDGIMASFGSALDAVLCAKELQVSLKDMPDHSLKIGIHLGDVIEEKNDIFGDGVNVASRIEALGKAGTILISEAVYVNIRNKEGIETIFLGRQKLKNVQETVKIYQVLTPYSEHYSLPGFIRQNDKKRRRIIQLGLLASLVVYLSYVFLVDKPSADEESPFVFQSSIAVLPFKDLLLPDTLNYLNGVVKDIRNSLSAVPGLRVVGETSSFQIRDTTQDWQKLGTRLNAEHLLIPQLVRDHDSLLIHIQLVNAEKGRQEFEIEYASKLSEIEKLKEVISKEIKLYFGFADSEIKRSVYTPDNEAYKLFLKGNIAFEQINFPKAVELYTQAVQLDPDYADAYAGLAAAYQWFSYTGVTVPGEAFLQAKDWGRKAINLDEYHPFANALLGIITTNYDLDYKTANTYFNKALSVAPSQSPHALLGKIGLFELKKDINRADYYMDLIIKNDPLNWWTYFWKIQLLRKTNRIREALPLADELIGLYPNNMVGPMMKSVILLQMDTLPQESVSLMRSVFNINLHSNIAHFYVHMLSNAGFTQEANLLIEQLQEREKSGFMSPCTLGYIYFLKGDIDQGFTYLEKALQVRDLLFLLDIESNPFFDPFRKDVRYQNLIDKMGLGKWLEISLKDLN